MKKKVLSLWTKSETASKVADWGELWHETLRKLCKDMESTSVVYRYTCRQTKKNVSEVYAYIKLEETGVVIPIKSHAGLNNYYYNSLNHTFVSP